MRLQLFAAFFVLAACNSAESNDPDAAESAPDAKGEPSASDVFNDAVADAPLCPVLAARDWKATIETNPDSGKRRLFIRGAVDLPTPGYEAVWRTGATDRAMPPGQRIHLSFKAPEGVVAQVVTTQHLTYLIPTDQSAYRFVAVYCGGEPLAEIADVTLAE